LPTLDRLTRLLAVTGQHLLASRTDPRAIALQAREYREYVVLILGQLGFAVLDDVRPASGALCVVPHIRGRWLRRKLLRKRCRRAGQQERQYQVRQPHDLDSPVPWRAPRHGKELSEKRLHNAHRLFWFDGIVFRGAG
jgi:hypothetical protein